METLYDILGVNKNATQQEIKKAYRSKSKSHHPDKVGENSMQQKINHAYSVLSNEVRKKKYDTTGEDKDVRRDTIIEDFIASIFVPIIEGNENVNSFNLISRGKNDITKYIDDVEFKIKNFRKDLQKYNYVLNRLKSRGDNTLIRLVNHKIDNLTFSVNFEKENVALANEVLVLLEDYNYSFDLSQYFN